MSKITEVKFPKIYKRLDEPYRYKVLYGGRAAARSWTIARNLLSKGAGKKLFILCTRELQKSIKQSVHKLLKNQIELMGLGKFYTATENSIKGINGTEFMFLGIRFNTEEIKSTEGIDIAWIEEGHNLTEGSWDIIDPTIRKEESEIWISYNTRFKFDHLHQLFVINEPPPDALIIKSSYKDNPYFPQVLQKQMETMKERDYEKYLHIWGGQLKKLAEGAIFGKQVTQIHKDGRLCFVPIEKNCEVMTFMDIGKNDETAIWFMQRTGLQYRFFDYFQGRLEEVEYYTKFIKAMSYLYSRHYLPHDADHQRLGMKRNVRQQFEDGGAKPVTIVPRIAHKVDAIELARDIFPNCWFHLGDDSGKKLEECDGYIPWPSEDNMKTRARRVEKGYEALCNYRYKYKEDDDVYQKTPHHDWASNGADAFMTFAQSDLNIDNEVEHLTFKSEF